MTDLERMDIELRKLFVKRSELDLEVQRAAVDYVRAWMLAHNADTLRCDYERSLALEYEDATCSAVYDVSDESLDGAVGNLPIKAFTWSDSRDGYLVELSHL